MIIRREYIKDACDAARAEGASVVLTNGCFDIIHAGHVSYLKEAARLGDILVVGLNSDASVRRLKGESRPVNSEGDRAKVLDALRPVDIVTIFDEATAQELARIVRPDVYVKGGDYSPENLPEGKTVRELGGKVVILPLIKGKSTTGVIERIRKDS